MNILLMFIFLFVSSISYADIIFSDTEKHIIQSLSSRNYKNAADPSNPVSGNPKAIKFGKQLFFDKRLSGDGKFSCASCHDPETGWSKHEAITSIRPNYVAKRHVPHLWGVRYNRWYFWDGRADSLWSQALMPIEDISEMAGSRTQVANLIIQDKSLRDMYQTLFGDIPKSLSEKEINHLFANIGKSIASFEETIISKNSSFDKFADQLQNNESSENYAISATAARGLKLFIGKANCMNCHFGPNFSDGEFHNLFLDSPTDKGRYDGITQLLKNDFASSNKLNYVYQNVAFRGQFKTPSLRNVALTYPYMHTGNLKTLKEVVNYYNTISDRIKASNHQEILLGSLNLSTTEQDELIEFLKTLNGEP